MLVEHPNGYSAKLYGTSSMVVYYEGKEVVHTGFRTVHTEEDVMRCLASLPKFMEQLGLEKKIKE